MQADALSMTLAVASERLLESRFTLPVFPPQPAAGADFTFNVTGGNMWELLSFRATLVTSAAVANRVPSLNFSDADGKLLATFGTGTNVVASTTSQYTWAIGVGYTVLTSPFLLGLPSPAIPLPNGYRISLGTVALDAADQWSNIRMVVREWAEADIVQECVELVETLDSLTLPLLGSTRG